MGEWLGGAAFAVSALLGVLGMVLGWGLSRWRYQQQVNRLTEEHQLAVRSISTKLMESERARDRVEQALAVSEATLNQQTTKLADTQAAAAQLANVQVDLATAQAAYAQLRAEQAQLLTALQTHEQTIRRQEKEVAAAEQECTNLQRRLAQLQQAADEQQQQLAQIQHAHQTEVATRHSFTADIAALYHRLHYPANHQPVTTLIGPVRADLINAPTHPTADHGAVLAAVPAATPNGATPAESATAPTVAQEKLTQFLADRGITIRQIPAEASTDPIINNLADFLGSHYEAVKPFYQQIKRNMQQGEDFTLYLKEETPAAIGLICQFGKKLYDVAFLEQYRYFRSPQYLLRAKTTRLPTALNFFSGQWLERYVIQQVQAAVDAVQQEAAQPIEFGYIPNPRIILPNGQDGELDLLFYVHDTIYWVETKSGDYQQHISKYSTLAQTLRLDPQHALMVLTDIPPSRSAELTLLFGMGVCALADFAPTLQTTLAADLAYLRTAP
jgi:hypothetical protein